VTSFPISAFQLCAVSSVLEYLSKISLGTVSHFLFKICAYSESMLSETLQRQICHTVKLFGKSERAFSETLLSQRGHSAGTVRSKRWLSVRLCTIREGTQGDCVQSEGPLSETVCSQRKHSVILCIVRGATQ
jgi:hypothetical protein